MSEFSDLIEELGFTKETYARFSGKSLNTIYRRTSGGDSFYPAPKEVVSLLRMLKNAKKASSKVLNQEGQSSKNLRCPVA